MQDKTVNNSAAQEDPATTAARRDTSPATVAHLNKQEPTSAGLQTQPNIKPHLDGYTKKKQLKQPTSPLKSYTLASSPCPLKIKGNYS